MATRVATAQAAYDLDAQDKGQRAAWVAERRELLSRRRLERTATEKRTLELEVRGDVTTPKQEVARIRGAARVGARKSEAAVEIAKSKAAAVAAEVLRVTEAGRPWALMREQAARAGRVEVEREARDGDCPHREAQGGARNAQPWPGPRARAADLFPG